MAAKRKLMLVDDDEAVVTYLQVKLSKFYDLVSTTEPLVAVAMATKEQPDAILCDIDMPGMSGGDVAAALEADPATARIPLVYLTSLVTPDEARALQGQLGGRPGVAKRGTLAELTAAIDAAIAG